MKQCKICKSFAINPNAHGRKDAIDLDLCDVCYWRCIAENLKDLLLYYNKLTKLKNTNVNGIIKKYIKKYF